MVLKFLCFLGLFYCVESYRILVVYPNPVRSLHILGEGLVKNLLKSGHEVTYVTSFPMKIENKNLRQIDISSNIKSLDLEEGFTIASIMNNEIPINDVTELQEMTISIATVTFEDQNLRDFLADTSQSFDVVVVDLYESEIYSGLSALYGCPMIWTYSMGAHWQPLRLIDEPTNPAYTADYLSSNVPPLNFHQRMEELWAQIKWTWIKWTHTLPKEKAAYQEIFTPYFKQRSKVLPDYNELIHNVSLILANEHHAFGNIPKLPQNFKLVGGYHIESPAKPLPENLQTLMDNAKHGVIYFSMGSTWSSKAMPKVVIEQLVKMFGELQQTVIWKFEEDLPDLPANLKIVKWAPQPSILAHPNCLFFITHGGLLSSTEAIHFGVPIIGIPIYFDQFININKAVSKGYAIRVPLDYDMPRNLRSAIQTMLKDPVYKNKAKELSTIYHDRPVPPNKEAVHWIEHVIRTKGAPHLKSLAFSTPFYQKLYLDLAGIIIILMLAVKVLLFKKKRVKKEKKY